MKFDHLPLDVIVIRDRGERRQSHRRRHSQATENDGSGSKRAEAAMTAFRRIKAFKR
jgi:hypothetical protein